MRVRYWHVYFLHFSLSIFFFFLQEWMSPIISQNSSVVSFCQFWHHGLCSVMLRKYEKASGMAGSVDRWLVQLRRTRRSPSRMDESSFHQLFLSARPQNSARPLFVFMARQKCCIRERISCSATSW